MGKKTLASILIIAVVTIVIIISLTVLGRNQLSTDLSKIGLANINITKASIFNQEALKDSKPPELSIKEIKTGNVDNGTENLSIKFNLVNPNKGTVILESISYNVYSN